MTIRIDGPLEPAAIRTGDHVCWSYRSDAEFRQIVSGYFSAGLRQGERIGFFAPSAKLPELTAWLSAEGHDLSALSSRGQLVLGDVRAAYLPDGTLDPDRQVAGYTAMTQEALSDGFTGLRVVGDVATLMADPAIEARWQAYELRADILMRRVPMAAICSYDRRLCDPTAIEAAESVHSILRGHDERMLPFRLTAGADGALHVAGEIDFANAEHLAELLREAAAHIEPAIDIAGVTFADVAGVRAIATGALALLEHSDHAAILGAGPVVRKLWSLMGFDRYETIRIVQ